MTKEELERITGQELIEERDYCGVDGYYGDYLDDVNAEMLKRFNHLSELEAKESFVGEQNRKLCEQQQKIEVLEEENAELKAEIENGRDLPAIAYMQGAEKQKKKDEEQLTKAKEIIEDLCGMVRELNKPNVQLTNVDYSLSEAEQFLSEVEK